jgi:SAM-dependent methyltransferase
MGIPALSESEKQAVKRLDIESSIRLKYEDPAEVSAYTVLAEEGLVQFEAALIRQSFVPGQRVLDVGCGGGREAVPMSYLGFRVIGMDFIPAMVQAARTYAVSKGQEISFLVGDLTTLPFREATFDGVTMLGQVIAFIPGRDRRVQALRSAWKALRPGGMLAMTTHNRGCRWKFRLYFAWANRIRRLARHLGYDGGLGDNDRWTARISQARSRPKVFFHMYDHDEVITDLHAAGFEVLKARARAEYEADRDDPALRARDYLLGFIARRPY